MKLSNDKQIVIGGRWSGTNPHYFKFSKDRAGCIYRHENGNCLVVGGFCTAVDDKYCLCEKEGGD